MFYITIWNSAASYKKKTSVPATHTHAHTDMYTLPKAKQMTHQAHISPKFSNSQNRKHQAKLSLLRCAHTHHFHFDSVFLTYGFLSPPASSLLHVLNLRRYNKPNLNITSAVGTKGRRETQKQSFEGLTQKQFLPLRWAGVSRAGSQRGSRAAHQAPRGAVVWRWTRVRGTWPRRTPRSWAAPARRGCRFASLCQARTACRTLRSLRWTEVSSPPSYSSVWDALLMLFG